MSSSTIQFQTLTLRPQVSEPTPAHPQVQATAPFRADVQQAPRPQAPNPAPSPQGALSAPSARVESPLPTELWLRIFMMLPAETLWNVRLTSHQLSRLASDPALYRPAAEAALKAFTYTTRDSLFTGIAELVGIPAPILSALHPDTGHRRAIDFNGAWACVKQTQWLWKSYSRNIEVQSAPARALRLLTRALSQKDFALRLKDNLATALRPPTDVEIPPRRSPRDIIARSNEYIPTVLVSLQSLFSYVGPGKELDDVLRNIDRLSAVQARSRRDNAPRAVRSRYENVHSRDIEALLGAVNLSEHGGRSTVFRAQLHAAIDKAIPTDVLAEAFETLAARPTLEAIEEFDRVHPWGTFNDSLVRIRQLLAASPKVDAPTRAALIAIAETARAQGTEQAIMALKIATVVGPSATDEEVETLLAICANPHSTARGNAAARAYLSAWHFGYDENDDARRVLDRSKPLYGRDPLAPLAAQALLTIWSHATAVAPEAAQKAATHLLQTVAGNVVNNVDQPLADEAQGIAALTSMLGAATVEKALFAQAPKTALQRARIAAVGPQPTVDDAAFKDALESESSGVVTSRGDHAFFAQMAPKLSAKQAAQALERVLDLPPNAPGVVASTNALLPRVPVAAMRASFATANPRNQIILLGGATEAQFANFADEQLQSVAQALASNRHEHGYGDEKHLFLQARGICHRRLRDLGHTSAKILVRA